MPDQQDPQIRASTWHAIGLVAYLLLLLLYGAAGQLVVGFDPRLNLVLVGAVLTVTATALVGWWCGWYRRAQLLVAWPVAALIATAVTGAVQSAATRDLPGTITLTFAYLGLTSGRWYSLVLLPLGVAAYVLGGAKTLPDDLPVVIATSIMWVLIAEVPAWLIGRLRAQSSQLRALAETDPLTHVLSRTTLTARLSLHSADSAVVLIDLNNFKSYNDTHGHAAGDQLLVDFAHALRRSIRKDDMIFRIGGDEFLAILVGADHAAAQQVLDRLDQQWTSDTVSFSAGISVGEQDHLRVADQRMYDNKRSRRKTQE